MKHKTKNKRKYHEKETNDLNGIFTIFFVFFFLEYKKDNM